MQLDFEQIFNIMDISFPRNEMRGYQKQKALLDIPDYKILQMSENEEVLGFLAYWEYDEFRYIEHLATLPKTRGRGHGKQLVEDFLKLSSKPVVLEVELPENDIARRRIGFYERLGFKFNNHEYFQPPFHSDCEPLPLRIMSYPNEISKSQQDEYFQIIKSTVYKYI